MPIISYLTSSPFPLSTAGLRGIGDTYSGPITHDPHMNTHIILLRRTGKCKRMILQVTYLGATDENILTRFWIDVFFLDLDFQNFRGMEDEFGNVGDVSGYTLALATMNGMEYGKWEVQ